MQRPNLRPIAHLATRHSFIVPFIPSTRAFAMQVGEAVELDSFDIGEKIGPTNRYLISRKLGYGMTAMIWLARDQKENKYVAIKALNYRHTKFADKGLLLERPALERLSDPPSPHCLRLLGHFTVQGKKKEETHLCLVTPLLGGDAQSLYRACQKEDESYNRFPLSLTKRILLHTLRGVAHAHKQSVIHTDLKLNNIFFDTELSNQEIEQLLRSEPSRSHSFDNPQDAVISATFMPSQPLPLPTLEEAMKRTYVLADFGSAQPFSLHTQEEITPFALRPPEVFIGGPWNEKVDIWTFGCMIFELATGKVLFNDKTEPKWDLDEVENMLYQMLCFTQTDFSAEQLTKSSGADKYFDSGCNLRKNPDLINWPLELSIRQFRVMDEPDVLATGAIINRCIKLNPDDRSSAEELLTDAWFEGVD